MKIGLSSYSLNQAIQSGKMSILDAIEWVAAHGADHMEIVPIGFSLENDEALIDAIKQKAAETGIELSHYLVGGNVLTDSEEAFQEEIEKLKKHVEIAHALGIKTMRHDVAWQPIENTTIKQFEEDLPTLVDACRQIADYASQYGITTSIENHGFHVQGADRVLRLLHEVNRENFKLTVDVGNFMCVDENSVAAVKKTIDHAIMVHMKDFYLRPSTENPGEGWFQTTAGNYLRGAIVGHGDIDIREVVNVIQNSNYTGDISIEFEGMEECKKASKIALDNVKRFFNES